MTDVTIVIDGHTTDVHPNFIRFDWFEYFLPTGQSIEELEHEVYAPGLVRRLGQ